MDYAEGMSVADGPRDEFGFNYGWLYGTIVEGTRMKRISNLYALYDLGRYMREIEVSSKLSPPPTIGTLARHLFPARYILEKIVTDQIMPLPKSRAAAAALLESIKAVTAEDYFNKHANDLYLMGVSAPIEQNILRFQFALMEELKQMHLYSVTQTGAYDVDTLVEKAESQLSTNALATARKEVKEDLCMAGRCLSFDLPTASGFHSLRAIEDVGRKYHKAVTGKKTPNALHGLIDDLRKQLAAEEAVEDKKTSRLGLIIAFLERIKDIFRNPIMHPQMTLDHDAAKRVFDMACNVISEMEEDTAKRTAK